MCLIVTVPWDPGMQAFGHQSQVIKECLLGSTHKNQGTAVGAPDTYKSSPPKDGGALVHGRKSVKIVPVLQGLRRGYSQSLRYVFG